MLTHRRTWPERARWIAGVIAIAAFGGCSNATEPSGNTSRLTTEQLAALNLTIQDEYQAELTYERVINTFGDVLPFVNIVRAENRHSTAIASLFVSRQMDVPESTSTMENVPLFTTVRGACSAGVSAEILNVALYDSLLITDLPQDIRTVFGNNRRASLENHLPAFQACQ